MSESWLALRDADRDLALCLLFSPAAGRAVLADRLHLALEAETAVRGTSEPMLAAIRLQWWVDSIEQRRHESVPLMRRLLVHIEHGRLDKDAVLAQMALWQERLADDRISAGSCWRDLFTMLAERAERRDAAGYVGMAMGDQSLADRIDAASLAVLRDRRHYWIWMAGQVTRYRMSGAVRDNDPLLIWRMLGWRLGIRLP